MPSRERTRVKYLLMGWFDRPVNRAATAVLVVLIAAAPWILFFDPIAGLRPYHISRNPLTIYRLYNDDFAYVGASRNLHRTLANLFVPHNTHIVPAWRVLTWCLVAMSGKLANLPLVLAPAAYTALVLVMLMTGLVVARESGQVGFGLAASAAVGTTSLMATPACWYSAGQTLWAGFGMLAALWFAQSYRRSRARRALVLSGFSVVIAGWFWSIGYLAGPVAAIYLWLDGRRHCRLAAAIPLCASILAVVLALAVGGRQIGATVVFHGKTPREAADPMAGLWHTGQAIPENLILGNFGIRATTTAAQGMTITCVVLGIWAWSRLRGRGNAAFNSLECAGVAWVLGTYLIEWTVRGYMPFRLLRTVNLGMVVPWYDAVPQIGAVLFVAGWCSALPWSDSQASMTRPIRRASRLQALGVIGIVVVLWVLHYPRVDRLWRNWVPPLSATEEKNFPILALQSMRADLLIMDRASCQRRHLRRLDRAEAVAARLGIGRDGIRAAFGRLDMPELPSIYDAADLLDLPDNGKLTDRRAIRQALGPFVFMESQPRPPWLSPDEPWPPRGGQHWSETDVDDSE